MITHLTGKLIDKKPPHLVMDVQGIGYEVFAPMSTFYQLPDTGNVITLLTHFIVREDAQLLFGFYKEHERKLFRALIKINGIGPKLALTILSGIESDHFIQCIQTQNAAHLVNIPGIGKKTAERLMVEMRDTFEGWENTQTTNTFQNKLPHHQQTIEDAISALTALGYKSHEAKNAVIKAHQPNHTSEQLIRVALQNMLGK